MTLPAHRFLGREEQRKQNDSIRTWVADYDGTITGAPEQMARIAQGLKALGDRIIVLTGNKSPRADLVKQLDDYGFPFDELVQYHDDGTNGIERADHLKQFDAWCAFDNRVDRAIILAKVCPHLFLLAEPTDDEKQAAKDAHSKKNAKQAAKALRSVGQDNDAYREGVADRLAGRPMLTAAEFAASHPDADADDYPFYVAGYESDCDDLELVPMRSEQRGAVQPPPNLRVSDSPEDARPEHECGTCKMWDPASGTCWGYGLLPVDGEWVCDSWTLDPNWQAQDAAQDAAEGQRSGPRFDDGARSKLRLVTD